MRYLTLGLLVLLTGCATAQPPLPEAYYRQSAGRATAIERCGIEGNMDAATAAEGLVQTQEALHSYAFDASRYQNELQGAARTMPSPTREQCNAVAMELHTRSKDREGNMAYAKEVREEQARLTEATRPRGAYCNQIGTRTLCGGY